MLAWQAGFTWEGDGSRAEPLPSLLTRERLWA